MEYLILFHSNFRHILYNIVMKTDLQDILQSPAVVYANYVQFAPGFTALSPQVESRLLLIVKSGKGSVAINGNAFSLVERSWCLTPWGASIEYRSDNANPFFLAGVHLLPYHAPDQEIEYSVSHDGSNRLAGLDYRHDAEIPALEECIPRRLTMQTGLESLVDYIVTAFHRGRIERWRSENWARLLIREMQEQALQSPQPYDPKPPLLFMMEQYLDNNMSRPVALNDLVTLTKRSASTINRLLKERTGMTASPWIRERKIKQAKRLLQTTSSPIHVIARQTGFEDVYYFSRVFKQEEGLSPQTWRRQNPLL